MDNNNRRPSSLVSTANEVDWQEEAFQKIRTMKETYLPDLSEIYQRAVAMVQQQESLPPQHRLEQFEKLKHFKTMVELMIQFTSLSKRNITPAIKDKVAFYERVITDVVYRNSLRKPVQQGQLPQSEMQQQSSHGMFSSQGQQSQNQPSQQQMMPLQSHHQQLGLQQQPNLLQQDVQQRLQSSGQVTGSLLPPQNVVDQQRQLYQSQRTLPEIPSSLAQTESGNAVEWQEEVFQKIKTLKDAYLSDLTEFKQRVAAKVQQNSLPQQQRSEQFQTLRQVKAVLELLILLISVSKSNIMPALKDKVASFEKHIIYFVNVHRASKQVRQGQRPQPQMQPMQQQSFQNGKHSHYSQANPQRQSIFLV